MPDSSLYTISRREEGGILLAALVVTLLATTLVLGITYEIGVRLEGRSVLGQGMRALASAQAGLEAAARLAADPDFLQGSGTAEVWMQDRAIGPARVTVRASDPRDGVLGKDPARGSSDADTVRLIADATVEGTTRYLTADYLPLPHFGLRYAACSATTMELAYVHLEGRVRASGAVLNGGSADIYGDITTVTGSTVTGDLDDGDTDVFYVADSLALPAIDFDWFCNAGERITLPAYPLISYATITSESNPYGNPSAAGIYYIDANDQNVYFDHVALIACLVIINARRVYIGDYYGNPTHYYHASPDPEHLPAMLVEGDLTMRIDGGHIWTITKGPTTIQVSCALEGVFCCTEDLIGPQQYATDPIEVEGAFLGETVELTGPGTLIRHNPALNAVPLVEMTRPGLRLLAGTTEEP